MSAKHIGTPASWLSTLTRTVEKRPLVVFRFSQDNWGALRETRRGPGTFTMAQPYASLRNVRAPTACILVGREFGELGWDYELESGHQFASADEVLHFGLLQSKSSITTLESRLKITHAQRISPSSEKELLKLLTNNALRTVLRRQLKQRDPVVLLSPALSAHLIEELAKRPENVGTLRRVAAALDAPGTYSDIGALQEDAVGLALKAFGLSSGEAAARIEIPDSGGESTLSRIGIREDAVIEHHARVVPGFSLSASDLTGRAVFRKGVEVLEIITANKRPLEEVLGVDLIYLNAIKQNVVMVQYKMLEPSRRRGTKAWIYRPDGQLAKELARMQLFNRKHAPGAMEYRINPQVFYLRFVRRDAVLGQSSIILPVDHFRLLERDRKARGPQGAFRISYESLAGRYLRQEGFLDLIRSGYIGAYAKTTAALTALIRATLKNDRAVVAAVQSSLRASG